MEYTTVTASDFAALDGMGNWIYGDGTIRAEYTASSFPGAADLAKEVADAAEEANHHPDLAIRYPGRLEVVLTTHDAGGLTSLDIDLARVVDRFAAAAGATPDRPGRRAVRRRPSRRATRAGGPDRSPAPS